MVLCTCNAVYDVTTWSLVNLVNPGPLQRMYLAESSAEASAECS